MSKTIRCFAAVMMVILATMIFAGPAPAQDGKFDPDTISGLGARNIGSAAMSGRVAAIAAVKEDGRLTDYVGAASGDRKSTRLNSSHGYISYAVFCLKKKTTT